MVDHTTEDGKASTKASLGSKFTLSCSRCRSAKLKCDRSQPCIECVKRNVGEFCVKDARQPRAKKVKTTKTETSRNQEAEVEDTAQLFEHFVDGTFPTNNHLSALLEPTSSFVAPDYPNMYWSVPGDPQRSSEKFALLRAVVDAIPELDLIHLHHEVFVTRCQAPLGNTVHTPTFIKQTEKFCSCLNVASSEARVMGLSDTIRMDTLACHLLALVLGLAFHPKPSLLGWFPTPLTLRVEELRASDLRSRTWRSLALRCLQGGVSLFCGSIASLQAALMVLLDGQEESLALDAVLVTAISGAQKLGLHRLGDARLEAPVLPTTPSEDCSSTSTEPSHIRTETGVRIWWALVMRDWSRGQALDYYSIHPSQFNTRMPLHINDVDLCPTDLEVNVHGYITDRSRSEFTMLSYTIYAIEIAVFARESVDLCAPLSQTHRLQETNEGVKMRNYLNRKYEIFVTGLPSYFRLGSTVGLASADLMVAIPVQRWMLHQQLWSLFLRLHRVNLSSEDGRASCQLLAQNIISTQAHIQARCAVCGSLSTSETQLFNAALVLQIDLLLSARPKDVELSSAHLSRLMIRDKIREAIDLLRTRSDAESSASPQDLHSQKVEALAQRSIIVLEALMKLEGENFGDNEASNRIGSPGDLLEEPRVKFDKSAKDSLKKKIMDILKTLQGNAKITAAMMDQASLNSFPALDMSMPPLAATDGSQDLGVLPVLSNDPSYDIWQYLDFDQPLQYPDEDGSFPASVDL